MTVEDAAALTTNMGRKISEQNMGKVRRTDEWGG
jgi:hypothetical protein